MTLKKTLNPRGVAVAAVLLAGALAPAAHAGLITLSTHTTGEFQADKLKATLDFQTLGSSLIITVNNISSAADSLWINQIFFNAGSDVSSLQVGTLPSGWSLQRNRNAGGFGRFDYALIGSSGVGSNAAAISPGQSATFTIDFTGDGVTDTSFLTGMSTGSNPMIAAAKFIVGTDTDQTGFGGTNAVPAPGAALALLGTLIVGRSRRRRT